MKSAYCAPILSSLCAFFCSPPLSGEIAVLDCYPQHLLDKKAYSGQRRARIECCVIVRLSRIIGVDALVSGEHCLGIGVLSVTRICLFRRTYRNTVCPGFFYVMTWKTRDYGLLFYTLEEIGRVHLPANHFGRAPVCTLRRKIGE